MAGDTRDRLVEAALRLFAEKGYLATSVAEILERAGASSGSLYQYFPINMTSSLASSSATARDSVRCCSGPRGAACAIRSGASSRCCRPTAVCWSRPNARTDARSAASRSNCTSRDPIGREKLAANIDGWSAAVERCLGEARARFPDDVDLGALATFILTTMEGGVMLARTHRDVRPFDAAVTQLRRHLELLNDLEPRTGRARPRSAAADEALRMLCTSGSGAVVLFLSAGGAVWI